MFVLWTAGMSSSTNYSRGYMSSISNVMGIVFWVKCRKRLKHLVSLLALAVLSMSLKSVWTRLCCSY